MSTPQDPLAGRIDADRPHSARVWNYLLGGENKEIARFFDGLELVEPGVVTTAKWRPDAADSPQEVNEVCGIGRKL